MPPRAAGQPRCQAHARPPCRARHQHSLDSLTPDTVSLCFMRPPQGQMEKLDAEIGQYQEQIRALREANQQQVCSRMGVRQEGPAAGVYV